MGKIIWLASYPKSGNTWMRAFLHNLLRNPSETYDLNQMTDFSWGDSHGPTFQKFLLKPCVEMTDEEVAILRPKVQEYITKRTPDNVFVKTHNAFVEFMDRPLHYMEHTAGAIYIVRNPLDMVISYADHVGTDIDEAIKMIAVEESRTEPAEHMVSEFQCSWSRHVESWTANPSPAMHVIRYEDMANRPMRAFEGLVQFLNIPADRPRIARAIELSSFESLRKAEQKTGFVERSQKSKGQFFRQGKAEAWRGVLTPAQVDAVVVTHKTQMSRFGYWPIRDWPPSAAAQASAPAGASS